MDAGLLSLKWNNHSSTFFDVLESIRKKGLYSDVTIACDGKYFEVHKLVLSTCSDYFQEMFERTQCKHPIVVLKDISQRDLEFLLNYMYIGEVNVLQNELASLIKAAECLRVKGLAVPDEPPSRKSSKRSINSERDEGSSSKRNKRNSVDHSSLNNKSDSNVCSSSSPAVDSNRNKADSQTDFDFIPVPVKEENVDPPPDEINDDGLSSLVKYEQFEEVPVDDRGPLKGGPGENNTNESTSFSSQIQQQSQDDSINPIIPSTSGFGDSSWSGDIETIEDDDEEDYGGEEGNFDPNNFLDPSLAKSQMGSLFDEASSQYQSFESSSNSSQYFVREAGYWRCLFPGCHYKDLFKSNFTVHTRIHTGEKPFHCEFCQYKSTRKSNLTRHVLIIHGFHEQIEKP